MFSLGLLYLIIRVLLEQVVFFPISFAADTIKFRANGAQIVQYPLQERRIPIPLSVLSREVWHGGLIMVVRLHVSSIQFFPSFRKWYKSTGFFSKVYCNALNVLHEEFL